jgi:hypothetical protein
LLCFGSRTTGADALGEAFAQRRVPLSVLHLPRPKARELYGCDYALIAPDQHVVWRGNAAPADAEAVIDRIRGA